MNSLKINWETVSAILFTIPLFNPVWLSGSKSSACLSDRGDLLYEMLLQVTVEAHILLQNQDKVYNHSAQLSMALLQHCTVHIQALQYKPRHNYLWKAMGAGNSQPQTSPTCHSCFFLAQHTVTLLVETSSQATPWLHLLLLASPVLRAGAHSSARISVMQKTSINLVEHLN